ncbi:MAG TPA: hypothetical protein VGM49_08990 [Candidatus Limnocylindrales bacterium]
MKATIDIPDRMYRQVKAHAALQGRAIREVTIELYQRWLEEQGSPEETAVTGDGPAAIEQANAWLARWDAVGVEVATKAIDARPASEILIEDRR